MRTIAWILLAIGALWTFDALYLRILAFHSNAFLFWHLTGSTSLLTLGAGLRRRAKLPPKKVNP
jgi:hypothetical protein